MARALPTAVITTSNPRPPVGARASAATSPFAAFTVCVAPNARACASLSSFTSIATSGSAPASAAPWTQLRPTPPQPTTATASPACTFAVLIAAPKPVMTPQEIRLAASAATPAGILTTWEASTTTLSAKPPTRRPARTGRPSPSVSRGAESMANSVAHWVGMPASQNSQRPHERSSDTRTRSPTPMSVAPATGPTSVTTPATSCPKTAGRAPPQPPSM